MGGHVSVSQTSPVFMFVYSKCMQVHVHVDSVILATCTPYFLKGRLMYMCIYCHISTLYMSSWCTLIHEIRAHCSWWRVKVLQCPLSAGDQI